VPTSESPCRSCGGPLRVGPGGPGGPEQQNRTLAHPCGRPCLEDLYLKTSPRDRQRDAVTCIEVIEHLPCR
jgi:hypothetical protein